jgi:uncharacterized protein YqeY
MRAFVGDAVILAIMGKMVKQRQSAKIAKRTLGVLQEELSEIRPSEEFLPPVVEDEAAAAAVRAPLPKSTRRSIRDMEQVMEHLRAKYTVVVSKTG